jgi:hypothetical protein
MLRVQSNWIKGGSNSDSRKFELLSPMCPVIKEVTDDGRRRN